MLSQRVVIPGGMTFHVRCHGEIDAPPLVFLHGVLSAAISYDVLCEGLARHRRVVAIDQRGHGDTDHADDYAWARWVEDVAAVIESLGLGVVDLVGHSMGAAHAARFAALNPGAVRRLALIEGGIGRPNAPSEPDYWARVAQLFPPEGFATLREFVTLATSLFPRADPAIVDRSTANFVRAANGRWSWPSQADMKMFGTRTEPPPDVERLRASVGCPTLVARAEHSEVFVGDDYKTVAAEYTNGQHRLLAGAGHMVMWEGVDNTLAVLDDFLG